MIYVYTNKILLILVATIYEGQQSNRNWTLSIVQNMYGRKYFKRI